MKIRCELVETYVTIENVSTTDYGLRFYDCDNTAKTVRYYCDLFCNEAYARSVVELLNEADISEVHIGDIIEDLLCE